MPDNFAQGGVINVRLDKSIRDAVKQYLTDNDLSISEGVRMLLSIGLRGVKNVDQAACSAAYTEGYRVAVNRARKASAQMVTSLLDDLRDGRVA